MTKQQKQTTLNEQINASQIFQAIELLERNLRIYQASNLAEKNRYIVQLEILAINAELENLKNHLQELLDIF